MYVITSVRVSKVSRMSRLSRVRKVTSAIRVSVVSHLVVLIAFCIQQEESTGVTLQEVVHLDIELLN
jgi:hypothetical protein